jgi:hypothetical protein
VKAARNAAVDWVHDSLRKGSGDGCICRVAASAKDLRSGDRRKLLNARYDSADWARRIVLHQSSCIPVGCTRHPQYGESGVPSRNLGGP